MKHLGPLSLIGAAWLVVGCAPPGQQPTTLAIQTSGLSARLEMMAPEQVEDAPTEAQTAAAQSAEAQSAEAQSAEAQSAEAQSAEAQSAEAQSAEAQSAAAQSAALGAGGAPTGS